MREPTLLELYETMLRIRRFEERVLEALLQGKLASTMCHVGVGQEAVAAGVCAAMAPEDFLTSNHRGHGHLLARGGDLGAMLAELFGKTAGTNKGRAASMHFVDASVGHLGSNAIVGGHLGIATGAALWNSISGQPRVTVAFFGEGALGQGLFHETLNLAALWNLPVVYVCENNQWAMSLPWAHATAQPSIAAKGAAYGIPGTEVDGQDVEAVFAAAREAIARARRGDGPTLLGANTYRFLGHSRGDPSKYRDPDEEARWRARDPLVLAEARLHEHGLGDEDFARLDASVAAELDAAERFADESPEPSYEDAFAGVYA
jgi:acetoin:2,6-dichlorophenolindophenol oxidoreductase subunit alpha